MATSESNTPDSKSQQSKSSNVKQLNQADTQAFDLGRLRQHDNAKIVTSIDQIGACLGYLAQCDYTFGNNGDALSANDHFGRGYLLEMLADGVNSFAKEYEQTEKLARAHLANANGK